MSSLLDFKKNTHIKITFVFIVFSIILYSIYKIVTPENLIFNPNNTVKILEFQYSIDGLTWFDYDPNSTHLTIKENSVVWVKFNIPDLELKNPVLFLATYNLFFDVFFDYGSTFSVYGTNSLSTRSPGIIRSFIEIPTYHTSGTIIIKTLQTSSSINNFDIYISYGELEDLFLILFSIGVVESAFSSIFLAIGIVFIVSFYKKAYAGKTSFYTGILFILYGLHILTAVNPFTRSLFKNLIFWQTLSIFILYIMFIPIILISKSIFTSHIKIFNFMINITLIFIVLESINPHISSPMFLGAIILFLLIVLSLYEFLINIKNYGYKGFVLKLKNDHKSFFMLFSIVTITILFYYEFNFLNNTNPKIGSVALDPSNVIVILLTSFLFLYSLKSFNEDIGDATFMTLQKQILITNITEIQSDLQKFQTFKESSDYFLEKYIDTVSVSLDIIKNTYGNKILKHHIYEVCKDQIIKDISAIVVVNKIPSDELGNEYRLEIISTLGIYKNFKGMIYSEVFTDADTDIIKESNYVDNPSFIFKDKISLVLEEHSQIQAMVYFSGTSRFSETQKSTFKTFLSTYSAILKNLLLLDRMKNTEIDTFFNLSSLSEARSKETGSHIKRVAHYSKILATAMKLPKKDVDLLYLASVMHDIGKLSIPDRILNKAGKLTYDEFEIMKNHAIEGFDMLNYLAENSALMNMAAIIAYHHHEKYDGTGYYGLEGEEISIFARIVSVADVFDALASDRVYKKAWSLEKILKLMQDERGKHFDPTLVDKLFENLPAFLIIKEKFVD